MSSLAARLAVAVQASKGTAATTGFHAMRSRMSETPPEFVYEEARDEHGGAHTRASTRQSTPSRISFMVPANTDGLLYPNAIGVLLIGAGLNVNTVNNTTYYTHTFTKSNVDAAKWLSVLHRVGVGADQFERKIKDVRLTQLTLTSTRENITLATQMTGIDEAASTGSETVTSESNNRIIPPTGTLTYGALALGLPRAHTITLTRPVDVTDQKQHTYGLADLPETGFEINGVLEGVDMPFNTYKKLAWGGTSGTAPSMPAVTDSLTVRWESAALIAGAVVPFSFQMALTKAEFRLAGSPRAQGSDIVRCNINYAMIDDVAGAPVTFTLINSVTAYS